MEKCLIKFKTFISGANQLLWYYADLEKQRCFSGVNFINIKRTIFLYECHFGSFYYVHVTRKKLPKPTIVQKICAFNVAEIDGRPT